MKGLSAADVSALLWTCDLDLTCILQTRRHEPRCHSRLHARFGSITPMVVQTTPSRFHTPLLPPTDQDDHICTSMKSEASTMSWDGPIINSRFRTSPSHRSSPTDTADRLCTSSPLLRYTPSPAHLRCRGALTSALVLALCCQRLHVSQHDVRTSLESRLCDVTLRTRTRRRTSVRLRRGLQGGDSGHGSRTVEEGELEQRVQYAQCYECEHNSERDECRGRESRCEGEEGEHRRWGRACVLCIYCESRSRRRGVTTDDELLYQLYFLLNRAEYDNIIRFSERGDVVLFDRTSPGLLQLFTKYYRHSNANSFVRQLSTSSVFPHPLDHGTDDDAGRQLWIHTYQHDVASDVAGPSNHWHVGCELDWIQALQVLAI
jgi:hypothetical protein